MAEDHHINLLEPSLDLMLRTAEVVEHIEQQARDRHYKDDYDPDKLEDTVMIPAVDTDSNDKRDRSRDDIDRRESMAEINQKNDKADDLRNKEQSEDNNPSDAVLDRRFLFYRSL